MQTLTFQNITLTPAKTDSQIWLTSGELAKALNYSDPSSVNKIYDRNSDEFTPSMTALIPNPKMKNAEIRIFSLKGCHLIAMFSRTDVAKAFRQWVLDILDKEVGNPVEVTDPLSTTTDRKGLVQAVNRLSHILGVTHSTTWQLVHDYMNISSVDELTVSQVPIATAHIHALTLGVEKASQATPIPLDRAKLYQVLADSADRLIEYLKLLKAFKQFSFVDETVSRTQFDWTHKSLMGIAELACELELKNRYNKPMFEGRVLNYYSGNALHF